VAENACTHPDRNRHGRDISKCAGHWSLHYFCCLSLCK
jgi:hypothetical protein